MGRELTLLAAVVLAGCSWTTVTSRNGDVAQTLALTPLTLITDVGAGDVVETKGLGAVVMIGPYGGHLATGWYSGRVVYMDDCGLALSLKTDRPDLIPPWLREPCRSRK